MPKTHDAPRLRCDQCQLLRINGVVCHEPGCPNQNARYEIEDGAVVWIKQRTCFNCGYLRDVDEECCDSLWFGDDADDDETDDDFPDDDTDSPRYCIVHDTFPPFGETCEECERDHNPESDELR